MESAVIETTYPISFREADAKALGEHLRHRHSVDLIGMKRVGISNFLRFFLYHEDVRRSFISNSGKHLFIAVDLNDLVERELYPFWTLTFKRILDEVEILPLPEEAKKKINTFFLVSIQSKDLFLLIDGVRKALSLLVDSDYLPTLFFLRFDRIKDTVTQEFFNNLQGLRDATYGKLAYVFTSFRSLDVLSPKVFDKAALSGFSPIQFIKPSTALDMEIICKAAMARNTIALSDSLYRDLFNLVSGNVQYLQIALIILHERNQLPKTAEELHELLIADERMLLQSEELWESLTQNEKEVVIKIHDDKDILDDDRHRAEYLWQVGIVQTNAESLQLFSSLFSQFLTLNHGESLLSNKDIIFSKKEHILMTFLESKKGELCEREAIIEGVWPEYQEFGVSDWSIDRLIARVRNKLKRQTSPFEIRTIRTRGYMLIERI